MKFGNLMPLLLFCILVVLSAGCTPTAVTPDPTASPTMTVEPTAVETSTSTPVPSPTPKGLRILALGDSYTIGQSVDESDRWPEQLADRLQDQGIAVGEVQIIARTGWTTADLDAAISMADPEGPFDIVTLLIGVNDQYRGRPSEDYEPAFRALLARAVDLAGGRADRVIVLSIPDWGVTPFAAGQDGDRIAAEIDAYNRINRQETKDAGAWYVDVTPISREAKTDASLLAGDGLHPSADMYARWVDLVLAQVNKLSSNGFSPQADGGYPQF